CFLPPSYPDANVCAVRFESGYTSFASLNARINSVLTPEGGLTMNNQSGSPSMRLAMIAVKRISTTRPSSGSNKYSLTTSFTSANVQRLCPFFIAAPFSPVPERPGPHAHSLLGPAAGERHAPRLGGPLWEDSAW